MKSKVILEDKHFRRLSITNKFFVSLFVVLILPLILLFFWTNNNLSHQIHEKNLKINLEVLKQTKSPITYLIQDINFVSLEILGNNDLQQYLIQKDSLSSTEKNQLKIEVDREMNKLISSRSSITRLSIFDDSIFFQYRNHLREESRIPLDEVVELKGLQMWLPAYYEETYTSGYTDYYEVSVVRAINQFDVINQIIAFLRINIYEEQLAQLYEGVAGEGTESIFIMNDRGEIISSNDKNMLGTSIVDEPYYKSVIEDQEGYLLLDNKIISFYDFRNINWYMVKLDDYSVITQRKVSNFIIMASIVFILSFAIIFYFIQRHYIINPLIKIKKDVTQIHEGQYLFNLHTNSEDEIGDLNKGLIEMGEYIQDLIERVYKHTISEKEAQLQYLQSQINPHFLYNTLDSARWLAMKNKDTEVAELIKALSNHFKNALNQGKNMTTVGEEVKHVKGYLMIQKIRFGEELNMKICVQEEIKKRQVLNLILQPIVENALIHGLEKKLGNWQLKIDVWSENNQIIYRVVDNGVGVDEELIRAKLAAEAVSNDALALNNVNKRLIYKYGEAYGLEFYSKVGFGTTVIVRIPILGEDNI